MVAGSFEEFVGSLRKIEEGMPSSTEDPTLALIRDGASALAHLSEVTEETLTSLIVANPGWTRVLGLAIGFGQEQLSSTLRGRLGSPSFSTLVRKGLAADVVGILNESGLVDTVRANRGQTFTYADVLIARYGSRGRAGSAISRGRLLEDGVQRVADELRLPYLMRGRFVGRDGLDAPCDLAIPGTGRDALIVVAIKGYNSTGSKLSTSVDEVRIMADIRRPTQYVFAVFDGLGWLGRKADLRKVFKMWTDGKIDGLYSQASLDEFSVDLRNAARRLGIEPDQDGDPGPFPVS